MFLRMPDGRYGVYGMEGDLIRVVSSETEARAVLARYIEDTMGGSFDNDFRDNT